MHLQHLMRVVFGRRQRISYLVERVPREILDEIFGLLSKPDQVCLALSCKSLYVFFLSYLNAQDMSQLFPRPRPEPGCYTDKLQARMQFLQQLGHRRWKYCDGCWKLHLHSAWHPLRHKWRSRRMPLCMPYAGLVDLCPCTTLSFYDKLQLMDTLRWNASGDPKARDYHYSNMEYDESGGYFQHECTFYAHPAIKIAVMTRIHLDEYKQNICVQNKYHFTRRGESTSTTVDLTWPYKKLHKWLRRFFQESSSSFTRPRYHGSVLCQMIPLRYCCSVEGCPSSVTITTRRWLGKGDLPDSDWKKHRYKQ